MTNIDQQDNQIYTLLWELPSQPYLFNELIHWLHSFSGIPCETLSEILENVTRARINDEIENITPFFLNRTLKSSCQSVGAFVYILFISFFSEEAKNHF